MAVIVPTPIPIAILVIVLTIIDQCFVFAFATYFLRKYLEKRKETKAIYELGLALFFLINFVAYLGRLFTNYIFKYFIPILNPWIEVRLEFTWSALTMISLIVLMFAIENQIWNQKTKYAFTIIYCAFTAIMIIMALTTHFALTFVTPPFSYFNLLLVFIIPCVYFYLAAKSSGSIRSFSLALGIGYFIMLLGGIEQPQNMMRIAEWLFYNVITVIYVEIQSILFITLGLVIIAIGIWKLK
ncbi:MAG: hypothetical protein ACTSRW_16805 [Candidatus Helarchaeota archaeon]